MLSNLQVVSSALNVDLHGWQSSSVVVFPFFLLKDSVPEGLEHSFYFVGVCNTSQVLSFLVSTHSI